VSAHIHPRRPLEDVTAIRGHGHRVTQQRALIWQALLDGGHLSAREVADAVRDTAPDLHQATIYRALDVFVEEGLVRKSELGGRNLYEIAAEHRHHHIVCTSCGAVVHVHDKPLRGAFRSLEAESGFALDDRELTFYGTCPPCRR
jgi:Fe2+ or Zn2+ uptake regulation protein